MTTELFDNPAEVDEDNVDDEQAAGKQSDRPPKEPARLNRQTTTSAGDQPKGDHHEGSAEDQVEHEPAHDDENQDQPARTNGRFDNAAPAYVAAGWPVVPIIPGRNGAKGTPLAGVTGWSGTDLDANGIEVTRQQYARANVAVRCPAGVIGIDVDAYDDKPGAARLDHWAEEWGPLPATYVSTSRDDGVSGIRWYRVPADWTSIGGAPGVELIQRHHRFALVAPSQHPSGRTYRWDRQSDELPPLVAADRFAVPNVADIPELPQNYLDGLAAPDGARNQNKQAGNPGDDDRLATTGDPCSHVTKALAKYTEKTEQGEAHHDAVNNVQLDLYRLGERDHPGVAVALADLFSSFEADRGDIRDTLSEWHRGRDGAVSIVLGNPSPKDKRGCSRARKRKHGGMAETDDRFTDARMARPSPTRSWPTGSSGQPASNGWPGTASAGPNAAT